MSLKKKQHLRVALATALTVCAVQGCKVGPDYQEPATSMPGAYSATQPATSPTNQTAADAGEARRLARWWERFGDEQLSSLVLRSAEGNLDLKLAQLRWREARALRGISASSGQPQVGAGSGYTRSRQSETLIEGPQLGSSERDLWSAGFDAAWELDIFGGEKRAVEAADAEIEANVENYRDVWVSLQAEVARNYVELRSGQARLAVTKANIAGQKQLLELTKAKFRAGLATELDQARSTAQVESTQAQLPSLESAVRGSLHRLAVLLGKMPAELEAELQSAKAIPVPPPTIPVGQPGELLQRRPDIRRAERELAAATALIGEAKADLYPKFSLLGNVGLQSGKLGNWWQSDSTFWSIGPQVNWSLLNGGRVRSAIEVQNVRQEQAMARYQQTVLLSVEEVENALVRYANEQRRRESLQAAVTANRRAVVLARELYTRGLSDFITVLDAERALYISEDLLVLSEQFVTTYAISIYKSLGGGWM